VFSLFKKKTYAETIHKKFHQSYLRRDKGIRANNMFIK